MANKDADAAKLLAKRLLRMADVAELNDAPFQNLIDLRQAAALLERQAAPDAWQPIGNVTPGVAPFDGKQVLLLTTDLDEPRTHGFWQEGVLDDGSDGYFNFAGWCWCHDNYFHCSTDESAAPSYDFCEPQRPFMWAPMPEVSDADFQNLENAIPKETPKTMHVTAGSSR